MKRIIVLIMVIAFVCTGCRSNSGDVQDLSAEEITNYNDLVYNICQDNGYTMSEINKDSQFNCTITDSNSDKSIIMVIFINSMGKPELNLGILGEIDSTEHIIKEDDKRIEMMKTILGSFSDYEISKDHIKSLLSKIKYNTNGKDNILAESHCADNNVTLNYYLYCIGGTVSDYQEGEPIEETLFVSVEL